MMMKIKIAIWELQHQHSLRLPLTRKKLSMGGQNVLLLLVIFSLVALETVRVHGASSVSITLLETAVAKGAVCLDGTPPGYAYLQGHGDGADKWIVYLQGGGWCDSSSECFKRSRNELGSSSQFMKFYDNKMQFDGMLDDNATFNPEFYNWNICYILYCDGSSFMSDVEEVDPLYNITYRGGRIFDAMMEELILNKGMGNANSAILAGTSAGALATILHCDKFRALFHNSTKVKCISDSGFFIHGEDFIGADWRELRFFKVISRHGLANSLPTSCTTKLSPTLCLFPENLVEDLQTPLFVIESAFDQFQIGQNVFPPDVVSHDPGWSNCTTNLMLCNWTDIKIMKDFRTTFIETLKSSIDKSSRRGYFVHSCYLHGHILLKQDWTCSSLVGNNILAHKTIGQAVSDWYFDRSTTFQEIDMRNDIPRYCNNTFRVPDFEQKCSDALRSPSVV